MSKSADWLANTRDGILAMCKDWLDVCGSKGSGWNIPQDAITGLDKLYKTAQTDLDIAKNETTRTPVATAQCKEAFDALISAMRDFKRRYFLTPPLSPEADFISLGLKPRDTTPTPSGPPTAQVTIETYLVGRHELGVKIIFVTGSPDDPANKGYRIWYSVVGQGETQPTNPDDLKKSFFTKRKKDVLEFDFGDSGKIAYFAVQIENEGKKGPWGPLTQALIP